MKTLLEQIAESEKDIVNSLYEIEKLKSSIIYLEKDLLRMENKDTIQKDIEEKVAQVPFVAYEIQLERHAEEKKMLLELHDAEKDKMRKHYKHIIIALCSVLAALIISIFGSVIWFLDNCDISAYTQEITTGDSGNATIEDGIHYESNK